MSDNLDNEENQIIEEAVLTDSSETTFSLELRGLEKWVDNRAILNDLWLDVRQGEILGILGSVGAGKSSLLKIAAGLEEPTKGMVWLDGEALDYKSIALRSKMGIVFEEPSLDKYLTAYENIELSARLFGIPRKEAKQRTEELLVFTELDSFKNDLVLNLTKPVRRRLEMARALIHGPELLLMDEPTRGLDYKASDRIWHRLFALRKASEMSILLSTQSPEEAAWCDRVALLDRGHVVVIDTPQNLLARVNLDIIEIHTSDSHAAAVLLGDELGLSTHVSGDHVILEHKAAYELVPKLAVTLAPSLLLSVNVRKPTLADVYLKFTGHSLDVSERDNAS